MEGAGTHGDENRGYMRGVSDVAEQEVTYDNVTVDVTVVTKPSVLVRVQLAALDLTSVRA